MAAPRVCVLRAPGTNCDIETAHAFERCGALADRVHLFRIVERPERLRDFQVLCLPGGFSYGDDIGAGVIFAEQLRVRLAGAMGEFVQQDRLVLGICNGFQVLLKSGLLPDGPQAWPGDRTAIPPATLTWNDNGKYTAIWVHLRATAERSVFLRGIDELDLPVAHGEGKLVVRDPDVLAQWQHEGRIALQYRAGDTGPSPPALAGPLPYPANPNGSVADIAGLSDASGRILGLMPHPERFIDATQHPQWTRRGMTGDGEGLRLFGNAVTYFE